MKPPSPPSRRDVFLKTLQANPEVEVAVGVRPPPGTATFARTDRPVPVVIRTPR